MRKLNDYRKAVFSTNENSKIIDLNSEAVPLLKLDPNSEI
jgi:hypothetical protein